MGADTITGGSGSDIFNFAVGNSVLTINGLGTSGNISGYDVITDFTPGASSEKVGFSGASISTLAVTNDSSLQLHTGYAVTSDSISNGSVTFNDTNGNMAVSLTSISDVAAVTQFLQNNDIGSTGSTVAFTATLSDGIHTYLYIQGTTDGATNVKMC